MRADRIRAKTVKKWRHHGFGVSVFRRVEHAQSAVCRGETQPSWAGNITYVWTTEGWLYLAVVLVLYLRRVIAWGMGSRMTQELPTATLTMAIEHRRPSCYTIRTVGPKRRHQVLRGTGQSRPDSQHESTQELL